MGATGGNNRIQALIINTEKHMNATSIRFKKPVIAALALSLAGLAGTAQAARPGGGETVNWCHLNKNGSYKLLQLSEKQLASHQRHSGDFAATAIEGNFTCEEGPPPPPPVSYLVSATTFDRQLILGIVDANGSGRLDPGDQIVAGVLPITFDAAAPSTIPLAPTAVTDLITQVFLGSNDATRVEVATETHSYTWLRTPNAFEAQRVSIQRRDGTGEVVVQDNITGAGIDLPEREGNDFIIVFGNLTVPGTSTKIESYRGGGGDDEFLDVVIPVF